MKLSKFLLLLLIFFAASCNDYTVKQEIYQGRLETEVWYDTGMRNGDLLWNWRDTLATESLICIRKKQADSVVKNHRRLMELINSNCSK